MYIMYTCMHACLHDIVKTCTHVLFVTVYYFYILVQCQLQLPACMHGVSSGVNVTMLLYIGLVSVQLYILGQTYVQTRSAITVGLLLNVTSYCSAIYMFHHGGLLWTCRSVWMLVQVHDTGGQNSVYPYKPSDWSIMILLPVAI